MNAPNQALICNPQIEWSELLSFPFQPFRVSSCVNVCVFDREKNARRRNEKKKRKERKRKNKQTQLPGFELALLRQLLASRAWNFTTQLRKQNTRYYVTITWPVWNRNTSHAVSKANKAEKKSEVNRAIIFCKKEIKAELIVTFQKIFSLMADFLDVVSVLPCNPTNKGKKNLCVCAKKLIDRENWSRIPFSS